MIRKDPYYASHCLPRILWYCQRKGWAWPGHAALPAVPPASELEALALAGVDVAAVLAARGEAEVEEEVPRGDSEASSSASTNSLATRWSEQDQDQGEELAVKEQQPAGVAAARASPPSPQKKQKRFLRRFFPRRKHKHKHHKDKAALVQVPVETERRASAAAVPVAAGGGGGGGGGGGKGAVAKAQQPHEQHGAQAPATPAARRRSSIPSSTSAQHAQPAAEHATATPPPRPPSPSHSPAPSPATRGEAAALWGLLGTPPIPALVLGYLLVRALVAPLVRAYAGAGGEAVVLAVLLQQATALLARHGWLPASAAGTWEVTLRFHLSHLVLCGSLVLAAAALAGAALQTQGWAASWLDREAVEAWDRRAGARVRAANTGLFLLLLGVVIVGHRREVRELLLGGGRRGERK